MKRSAISSIVAALALSLAAAAHAIPQKESTGQVCTGVVSATQADGPAAGSTMNLVGQVQCDYDCLARCKEGCKREKDSATYNKCLDQCPGFCGCK
jgi:hypothetical protein